MNKRSIVFSSRARQRMEEIADYLYKQQLSNQFVKEHLNCFEIWLETLLGQSPESGVPMPEYVMTYGAWFTTNTVSSTAIRMK